MRRILTTIAILAAAALLLVTAFAAQLIFSTPFDLSWPDALHISFSHWRVPFLVAIAAGITSLLIPIDRPRSRILIATLAHIAVAIALVLLAAHLDQRRLLSLPQQTPASQYFREIRITITNPANNQQQQLPPIPLRSATPPAPPKPTFWTTLTNSRWLLYLASTLIATSFAHAWHFYQQAQARERRAKELTTRLTAAKLDALRLQLQPHFLFNTLNAIATLTHSNPDAADEMLSDLSQLLRFSLGTTNHQIPLSTELESLDLYLGIEKIRLGHRLNIHRHIAPETLSIPVPPLLLQPLAENAVRYAIEPRSTPGNLTLTVLLSNNNTLILTLTDDGPGLPPASQKTERVGIGIANTQSRLHELYGPAATLTLTPNHPSGLTVQITLPTTLPPA